MALLWRLWTWLARKHRRPEYGNTDSDGEPNS